MQEISTYRQFDGVVGFYGFRSEGDWVYLGEARRAEVSPYWHADFTGIPKVTGTWAMVQDAAKRSLAAS